MKPNGLRDPRVVVEEVAGSLCRTECFTRRPTHRSIEIPAQRHCWALSLKHFRINLLRSQTIGFPSLRAMGFTRSTNGTWGSIMMALLGWTSKTVSPVVQSSKSCHDSDFGIDTLQTSKSLFEAALEAVLEGLQPALRAPAVGVVVQVIFPPIMPVQPAAAPDQQVPDPVCGLGPLAAPLALDAAAVLVAQAVPASSPSAQAALVHGGKASVAKKAKKKYKKNSSGKRLVKH